MSYIGISEYVIGVIHDRETWFYTGDEPAQAEFNNQKPVPIHQYSSRLADAKRYDDMDVLREELESLPKTLTLKILEMQRCPKCKREFIEHPAISREDNETEICPECGVREAVEAYVGMAKRE